MLNLLLVLLANESYQGQDTMIYLYICSSISKNQAYELVEIIENIIEAANFLNTSCKIIEKYLDTNKLFETKENKYLLYSKPMRNGDILDYFILNNEFD